MKSIKVKEIELKKGRPQIAAVITGKSREEIIEQVSKAKKLPCQMLEWRADYFFGEMDDLDAKIKNTEAHMELIRILDDIDYESQSMPLIFTLRTEDAGGRTKISRENAYDLTSLTAQSKLIDLVDIEFFDKKGELDLQQIVAEVMEIQSFGIGVILSCHEFERVLQFEELLNIAQSMRNTGANIAKIASKVDTVDDAKVLMSAAVYLTKDENNPVIITGLGDMGQTTRILGGQCGSCITFAYIDEPTAAGQLSVTELSEALDKYYSE